MNLYLFYLNRNKFHIYFLFKKWPLFYEVTNKLLRFKRTLMSQVPENII